MKIAVVFLVLLGVVAAVCALVLVNSLLPLARTPVQTHVADSDIEVLVAARPLAAMTVVDGNAVLVKKVLKSQLPEGALTNSVQVVGQILLAPMVEGEVFKVHAFARDGQSVHWASALPQGKRAVSINVQDSSGMAGLLYPGSVVDVLVSTKRGNGSDAEMVSATLLQGVQVLAIGSQSVTSEQYKDKNPGAMASRGEINFRMVTLLVDSKQAQMLQLAMQNGSISLAMRNPLDTQLVSREQTHLSDLAGGIFAETAGFKEPPLKATNWGSMPPVLPALAKLWSGSGEPTTRPATMPVAQAPAPKLSAAALWEMLIIRGTAVETRTFPMPTTQPVGSSATAGG